MIQIVKGMRIHHSRFGDGIVIDIDDDTPPNVSIDFDGLFKKLSLTEGLLKAITILSDDDQNESEEDTSVDAPADISSIKLSLKPSLIGSYYERECDKYLVYNSVTNDILQLLQWDIPNGFNQTAAAQAGIEWERKLLEQLKEDESCVVVDLKEENPHKVSLKDTVEALKSLSEINKPVYIYQACLEAPHSFNDKYILRPETVTLSSRMYPDFIKAEYVHSEQKYRLTIIDAKNASQLKIGAEIQICLYSKIIKAIIADEGIDNCYVNENEGIVWNREKITDRCLEHVFNMCDASAVVEEFFLEKIVSICDRINSCKSDQELRNKIDYCTSQYCDYCDNFEACKRYCAETKSVKLLPYITKEAQKRLKLLIEDGSLSDDSIESVKEVLISDPDLLTEDCRYWKSIKNNLSAYEKGLNAVFRGEKARFPKVGTSMVFPKGQNFSLILTAQLDVNSGRVYAYSWLLRPGWGIDIWGKSVPDGYVPIYESSENSPGKGKYYNSVVASDNTQEEFDRIDRVFVESIYELLRRIDNYSDVSKRKLQFYVMDDYERMNIENMLFNMLEYLEPVEDQELIEKVMTILFWMQGEKLVTESDLEPEETIENPITVLSTEISRLYVLSEPIAYNLIQTSTIFSPSYNFDNDRTGFFGRLSNVVDGMKIIRAWSETDRAEKNKKIERIAHHLRTRLFIEQRIITAVQKDASDGLIHLSAWPTRYKFQEPKYPEYPEIARLDFENRFEELLKYQQIRAARMSGIQNAIDNGSILWLEYSGHGNTFEVLNHENYIGREWFTAWICEDTPENRLQLLILQDKRYTMTKKRFDASHEIEDSDTVFYVAERQMDYNFVDYGDSATVNFTARQDAGFVPVAGKKYLLFEVYSDLNSSKTAEGIGKLVDRQELLDPRRLSKPTGISYVEAKEICKDYWSPDNHVFSPSQEIAFKHLVEQRLNILVGPPASGKTDFIARSLIALASYYKVKHDKKLKIMVTAMSHSAIENVLLKLEKMLHNENPCDIKLYKSSKLDDNASFAGKKVIILDDSNVHRAMRFDEIQIIGMTCWSAHKAFHSKKGEMCYFDMIVMDEASQVRTMDSFLNLECSDDDTRFLLVGDDDQLPPIIAGKYKEREGEKYIHGSIFHMFLTGLEEDHADIVRLSDNFRMNGALCKYPSKALYGPYYKAFNEAIRRQTISLKDKPEIDYLASILDEEYPLVFCELSGISRQQNEVEVKLVTDLVRELWNRQLNKESQNLASCDGNFWRDISMSDGSSLEGACGIITPHHEHINRLKTSISQELDMDRRDIFIGTVDKLQGKERKTVIVSYGVSETEKIISESEFIFSRNRFNVSITRGKAKTIVFLSDAIAETNMSTNVMASNDGALKKGIDFIHGFATYMKTSEDNEELITEDYPYLIGDVSLKIWKKKQIE
jgi:hypothetical protein